jgi:heme exporter protein B
MTMLRHAAAIAAKDLRSEFRTKESINSTLSFSVVILLLFSFAFDPSPDMIAEFGGGLLWIVFVFAGALIVNRSFARELPNDCIDVLVSSPASGASLFLGKAIAAFVLLFGIECICLPVFGIFYNITWWRTLGGLLGVLALGTWALACVGTFISALTVNLRLREVMLPMLVYPILIPALLPAMMLTNTLLTGQPIPSDFTVWLRLLIGFNIMFTTLSVYLAETVLVR